MVAFFDDHVAFGRDVFRRQADIFHPVRFHLHHQLEPIRGNPLEIGGIIIASEGVIAPTILGNRGGKFTGVHLIGGLEQQMFEKVRHAGRPFGFIRGTGAVPHHLLHGRGTVVFDDHDLHPVIQREMGNVFVVSRQRR